MSSDQYFLELWIDQLTEAIVPHIMNGFCNLYRDAKKINSTMTLKLFQKMMERIPDLAQSKLEDDYRILLRKTGKKHIEMEKIIKVVFATSATLVTSAFTSAFASATVSLTASSTVSFLFNIL